MRYTCIHTGKLIKHKNKNESLKKREKSPVALLLKIPQILEHNIYSYEARNNIENSFLVASFLNARCCYIACSEE